MVTNTRQLDLTFGALADPTRRAILARLARGETTVGQLARPFDMSRPAISKHLRVLERAGLVRRTADGRLSRCELDAGPMRDAAEWVERYRKYWEDQLDSLSRYLEGEASDEQEEAPTKEKEKPA
jgi:DNA-binding transcriptional ArsR family regulator